MRVPFRRPQESGPTPPGERGSSAGLTALFFAGILALYVAWSPMTVGGMGYLPESLKACRQITAFVTGSPGAPASLGEVAWPRHGVVELLVRMPFFLAGHLLGGGSPRVEDAFFSLSDLVLSAGLCSLLFLWVLRISGDPRWALVLGVGTAFGTMVWPYAYMGMEPAQSFFVLLAGFLVLGREPAPLPWSRTWAIALVLAVAISIKSNGIFLAPAVLFLGAVTLRAGRGGDRGRFPQAGVLLPFLVASSIFLLNRFMVGLFWKRFSGNSLGFLHLLVDDWMSVAFNLFSYLGSVNKSLVVFAPLTAVALWEVRAAWREDRRITTFALLVLLGMAGGMALTLYWTDETWGPRYLHVAVAPLVLLLALRGRREPFRPARNLAVVLSVVLGLGVSFLGSAFYYGSLARAARVSEQNTLENFQHNPVWNHVRFNARLLDVWLGRPVLGISSDPLWTPEESWLFGMRPPGAPEWKTVDLRPLSRPQPLLLRCREARRPLGSWWWIFPLALCTGILALAVLFFRAGLRPRPGH